jgi:hypothetical protein
MSGRSPEKNFVVFHPYNLEVILISSDSFLSFLTERKKNTGLPDSDSPVDKKST